MRLHTWTLIALILGLSPAVAASARHHAAARRGGDSGSAQVERLNEQQLQKARTANEAALGGPAPTVAQTVRPAPPTQAPAATRSPGYMAPPPPASPYGD